MERNRRMAFSSPAPNTDYAMKPRKGNCSLLDPGEDKKMNHKEISPSRDPLAQANGLRWAGLVFWNILKRLPGKLFENGFTHAQKQCMKKRWKQE